MERKNASEAAAAAAAAAAGSPAAAQGALDLADFAKR